MTATIKRCLQRLQDAGLDAQIQDYRNAAGKPTQRILVKHDYFGRYPTKDALNAHDKTAAIISRFKLLTYNSLSCYTATEVIFIDDFIARYKVNP